MTDNQFYIDKLIGRCAAEIAEWKQAASVEASLRREFYDRALTAEASLQEAYADHRKQKARIEDLEKALHDLYDFCTGVEDIRLSGRAMRQALAALESGGLARTPRDEG